MDVHGNEIMRIAFFKEIFGSRQFKIQTFNCLYNGQPECLQNKEDVPISADKEPLEGVYFKLGVRCTDDLFHVTLNGEPVFTRDLVNTAGIMISLTKFKFWCLYTEVKAIFTSTGRH